MTNPCLETFLFPEKLIILKGYFPIDWGKLHEELQKNVSLPLLHHGYAAKAPEVGRFPMPLKLLVEIMVKCEEL